MTLGLAIGTFHIINAPTPAKTQSLSALARHAMSYGLLAAGMLSFCAIAPMEAAAMDDDGALAGGRHRVIVSSDIGGTDPDDIQSMVHVLVHADSFDLEGLVSSPYGSENREHILQVIDAYEHDYPNLKTYCSVSRARCASSHHPAGCAGIPGSIRCRWRKDFIRDFARRMDRCISGRSGDSYARSLTAAR